MAEPVFDADARSALQATYPERPALLRHRLCGHPLFEIDALLALAGRMRPVDVEQNIGALPIGIDPADVRHNGLSAAETIRSIEENGSWMVLKFVEQDPAYAALLDRLIGELHGVVHPRTGEALKKEAFIFISSPGSITPFHFDPEHNILLQLRGEKEMMLFPSGDERIVSNQAHERFHLGGHRNLPFDERFADRGCAYPLGPGDAIYVPVKAPHWVRNGAQVSVSFSITWRSEWSYREADAHGFNAMLRRTGITPRAPQRYPRDNRIKSLAYRASRRLMRLV